MTDHDEPVPEPDAPEERLSIRIRDLIPSDLLDDVSLWSGSTDDDPGIVTDPIVSEIVRREVLRDETVKHHLPQGFDDMPLDQRRRLYQRIEEALVPEPDMGWITGAEFLEPTKDPDWLITDLITAAADGGRVLVAGPEKSFKSMFAVGCMVALASGEPLFNYEPWSVPEPGDVLAFMGEGGREWNRTRVIDLMQGYGFTDEQTLATVSRLKMATVPLGPPERFALKLEEELKATQYKLAIVDSLYVFGGQTERSQLASMGTLLVQWAGICERAGTTLMVVDHFRKATEALELGSVSGVGASQWAQAWILIRAKWNRELDKATLTAKTGARQSMGGVHRIELVGIMGKGPMLSRVEEIDEAELDPEGAAEEARLKSDALITFNRMCHDSGTWMTQTEMKRIAKTDDVRDYLLSRPHVAIASTKGGKRRWAYAAMEGVTLPPLPKDTMLEREPEFNKGEGDDDTAEGDTEE